MKRIWFALMLASALALASGCRSSAGSGPGRASAFEANTAQGTDVAAAAAATPAPSTTSGGPATVAAAAGTRKMHINRAELGEPAPDFTLTDVRGTSFSLSQFKGKTIVLEWFNPRCPYVIDAYADRGVLREMPERWRGEGVVWLTINSQGPEEPGSSVQENLEFKKQHGMRRPLLLDPTGVVGRAYGAKTTPHMFVVSDLGILVYRGALDNAPLGVVPDKDAKSNYVDSALRDLRSGRAVMNTEMRAYGSMVMYARP